MKMLFIASLFFSSSVFSTEYIVQLKQNKNFPKSLLGIFTERFSALGVQYAKVSTENKALVENIKTDPAVEVVEENIIYETFQKDFLSPDVSDFKKQWALKNMGNNEPIRVDQMSPVAGKAGADMNALKAWEITKGSRDVVIAVIDSGVDLTHPELKNNLWVNIAEKNGRSGVDDDGNGYVDDIHGYDFVGKDGSPLDENGHGTHCSGIIGAAHGQGKVAGMMESVSIMAVRFINDKGRGDLEGSIKAVSYAVENGAHILSNSWGSRGYSKILEDLIKRSNERGVVFVAAAGNYRFNDNDKNPLYPASYDSPNIITVSAYNARERHSAFSCFGKKSVHVAGPGTNIISTFIKTKKDPRYKVASGTSMATPYVSGMIGLFLSLYPEKLTPEEIKKRVIETAIPVEHLQDKNVAGGRVDAYKFLNF